MDFRRSPPLLLFLGVLAGVLLTEAAYLFVHPIHLPEGTIAAINDRDYYPAASSLIFSAKESVHVLMFSINYQTDPKYADSSVNSLVHSLVFARNRGLDVSVAMDSWPEGNSKTATYLRKNNIDALSIEFDGTSHAKMIIIDKKIVIVGSTNWSYHSLDKNHEANVVIYDRILASKFLSYYGDVINSAHAQAS